MEKKQYIYSVNLFISIIYLISIILLLFIEGKLFYPKSYSLKFFLIGIIAIIINSSLFIFERLKLHKKIRLFSIKFNLIEAFLIFILIISLSALGGMIYSDNFLLKKESNNEWSIGIYLSESKIPINFSDEHLNNPVLTRLNIFDTKALFIADPFLIYENNMFYMFFEIDSATTFKGSIGLAESSNGFNWTYKQIVLDEPFHLSYPCVFKYNNTYYMIPESAEVKSIRLYKALDFPYNWVFIKTLIAGGDFVDNTIFYFNDTWWLFTEKLNKASLYLYYSDSPFGPWIEHPKNPIVYKDLNISRPGGNVIVFDNEIIRYAQDDYLSYGNQIWAFEITKLSKNEYQEKRIDDKPILKGYDNWNKLGVHQISICRIDNKWIAAVDGDGKP